MDMRIRSWRQFWLLCGTAVAGLFALACALDSAECSAKWGDREHRWGILSGCMVKTAHGWLPSSSIREVAP